MAETTGCVFHIINGSFVDGYGIRTTVFLKGCPLRCIWCCNPEGQAFEPELKLTVSECNACGNCVPACPERAIHLSAHQGQIDLKVERKLCTNCGECTAVCHTGALSFFGSYYSVDQMFEILKKDELYFRSSDGGVTIGGGEPTWQAEFTLELIKRCKENYFHVALDTCGYVNSALGLKALEEADLILFDLKGMDDAEHHKNTGVSNKIILENLRRLNALGKEIIIRVPVIPGYTDSPKNLEQTAGFLSALKSVQRVDILPYHPYGKVKYAQLGKEYALNSMAVPPDRQEEIKALFESHGLIAQLGG